MRNQTPVQNHRLQPFAIFGYANNVVAKSTASRDKLNDLDKADSTPNRAFFVRDFRTPQRKAIPKNGERNFFSMVGRNGQPLSAGYLPCLVVCHPVTPYLPNRDKFSGSLLIFRQGLSKMKNLPQNHRTLSDTLTPVLSFVQGVIYA